MGNGPKYLKRLLKDIPLVLFSKPSNKLEILDKYSLSDIDVTFTFKCYTPRDLLDFVKNIEKKKIGDFNEKNRRTASPPTVFMVFEGCSLR